MRVLHNKLGIVIAYPIIPMLVTELNESYIRHSIFIAFREDTDVMLNQLKINK